MQKELTTAEKAQRRRKAVALLSLILVLILCLGLTWVLYRKLKAVGGTPEDFKSFIDTFGVSGWLVALGIQVLQVIVALIPGEVVEIGMGYAFGAVQGTVLCMVGVAIASTMVFLLTKRFGVRLLELFFPREKIDGLRFINSEQKLDRMVFILFFIPGTPKDLLTYFVGLTRMRLSQFLAISLIARIPSVLSSVIGGNLISSRNYVAAAILFAITGAVSLLGMFVYDALLHKKQLSRVPHGARRVVEIFLKLCAVPHGSGNTGKIAEWCLRFAKHHGLAAYMDEAGNVFIEAPATAGYENEPPIILQGHLDMVCEKTAERRIDFLKEAIRPVLDGDRLCADGTTLGADNGIGLALALAAMTDKKAVHPALQAVFTVDEETGMNGAAALAPERLHGTRLLNLDSEEEGILIAGCAGGVRLDCTLPVTRETVTGRAVTLTLSGLAGGHSGSDISKGRANAIVLLVAELKQLLETLPLHLTALRGGTVDNAIPAFATATVIVPADKTEELLSAVAAHAETLRGEWSVTDPDLALTAETGAEETVDAITPAAVLSWLSALPNGVQQMSPSFVGKPETSLNLGILGLSDDGVCATLSLRSFRAKALAVLAQQIEKQTADAGGKTVSSGAYPGWEFRKKSPWRDKAVAVFEKQYGHAPEVDAIHAGLECGLLTEKKPDLDCISLGPDITGAHSPAESVSLSSTERTYLYVCALLAAKDAE